MGGKAVTVDSLHRNQSFNRLPFMDRVCGGLKREIRLVEELLLCRVQSAIGPGPGYLTLLPGL